MGRREIDPRPEVEVLGSGSPPAPTQRVELQGRRPGRRGRGAALVAAVAAALAIGLAVDGSDDGSATGGERRASTTTTTESRRTTTTPVTVAGTGPVFEEETGGAVVLLGNQTTRWTWVDLDTGTRGAVEINGYDGPFGVAVRGGVVVQGPGGAMFRPVPEGPAVPLGPADQIVASGDPDAVWLLTGPADGAGDSTARLVDLAARERAVVLLPVRYVVGGTENGLLFAAGGRVYHATPDGIRPIATGDVVGSAADQAVVVACDDRAECALERIDVVTGHSLRYESLVDGYQNGYYTSSPGPGGAMAIIAYGPSEPTLVWFDATGRRVGSVKVARSTGLPVWLPGDLGLLVPTGRGLQRVRLLAGNVVLEPVERLADVSVENSFVIIP